MAMDVLPMDTVMLITWNKSSLMDSGVLKGFRDFHCHILPGVDDGSGSIEHSLEILRWFESIGVSEVFCTPHVMEDLPNSTEFLTESFRWLSEQYKGGIHLHLAAEYMLDQEFRTRLQTRDLLLLENDVVLVETSINCPPYNLMDMLRQTLSMGYRPMLAHPERYTYMSMTDYRQLCDMGVYLQLNLGSLTAYYGESARAKALALLREGLYRKAGSDCHRLSSVQGQYNRVALPRKVLADLEKLIKNSDV